MDPIPTPVFTKPFEGNIEAGATWDNKLYFEGAYSLPEDIAIVASKQFWSHGLDKDQEITSIAAGKFWPMNGCSILTLAGYGEGSHRTGAGYIFTTNPFNGNLETSIEGSSDFRQYFVEGEIALTNPGIVDSLSATSQWKTSYGFAGRLEYLDRYRFTQTTKSWSYIRDSANKALNDTSYTYDNNPNHTLSAGLAFFVSTGVSFVQLYSQIMFDYPLSGYSNYWDFWVGTVGLRVAF